MSGRTFSDAIIAIYGMNLMQALACAREGNFFHAGKWVGGVAEELAAYTPSERVQRARELTSAVSLECCLLQHSAKITMPKAKRRTKRKKRSAQRRAA